MVLFVVDFQDILWKMIFLRADGGSEELGLARGCVVSLNGIKDVVRQLKVVK